MISENLQLMKKEYKYLLQNYEEKLTDFISPRKYTDLSTQNLCTHDTHFRKIKGMIYKEMQYSNVKSHTGLASSLLFS